MLGNSSVIDKPAIKKLAKGAWLVVALLSVVGALNYIDRSMITTMRSSIVEDMPMTDGQFGLLTSVFLWVYGLLSPFAGFLADRFKRSRVIIVSLFVWSAVTWLTSYVTTFEGLLATRALMGISEACYIPAALALIVDYHRGSTRSLASGIHIAGIMIGQSLGFVGGWIAEKHEWTFAFYIFGIIGIAYSIILAFTLKDAPVEKADIPAGEEATKVRFLEAIKDLFSRRAFIYMLFFWGLMGIVGWMIMGWLPTYYKEQFNLSQGMAGLYATGYFYPASIVGLLLGGFLADRWSKNNPRARVMVPVIGLCIAAPCVFIAGNTAILPVAIVFFMIYGVTRTFTDANMMPILCLVADPRYRATGYGVLNMFATIIGGAGLYAGGLLRDADINLGMIYRSAAFILIICAFLLYLVKPGTAEKAEQ
ncbi:MFS transporter [Chitinophaga sp. MM2321]|uniref:MFS transporter n=1 Tax=Chitinophaga sp. MM2321 TaxID=3137178 RepID=UPI0032D56A58